MTIQTSEERYKRRAQHDEPMGIEITKCRGPVARPGRSPVKRPAVEAVSEALKKRAMTFRELLEESELEAVDVADALRLMIDDGSVSRAITESGVAFRHASRARG